MVHQIRQIASSMSTAFSIAALAFFVALSPALGLADTASDPIYLTAGCGCSCGGTCDNAGNVPKKDDNGNKYCEGGCAGNCDPSTNSDCDAGCGCNVVKEQDPSMPNNPNAKIDGCGCAAKNGKYDPTPDV